MVEFMHSLLLDVTKVAFAAIAFIAISANEVTSINNTQWCSIHLYVVQNWTKIPILFCLDQVNVYATSNNIFVIMFKCFFEFSGLTLKTLGGKLVNMGCNGTSVFQGYQTNMTLQFKEKVTPFLSGVHYFAHETNLVVVTLLDLDLVCQLEGILQNMYAFFTHNPKNFTKFEKFTNIMNLKKNKFFQNVKTRWISMLSLTK